MTDILTRLMVDHAEAARGFRERLFTADEDDAFQAERCAMLALVSHPPATLEQARRRARYLLMTSFPDDLTAEGLAFLLSFTKPMGADNAE